MKKKFLLLVSMVAVLLCVLAISVFAAENYSAEYTLQNKTTLVQYATFTYINKNNSQATVNGEFKDVVTITFLDENGNQLTKVPMWEYDEAEEKYYSLVWYIKDYELTYTAADLTTWAQGPDGKWGNQKDINGAQRRKYTAATYTLASVRAVDLTCEYGTDKRTYSYNNAKHENCTWTWSKNGQTFTSLNSIYLDEAKTIKLQSPVGIGANKNPNGYEGYEAQFEATGNKIVVANLKDLSFQTHNSASSNKALWTLATNLQCLWYPDTVVHLASGVGSYIREVKFDGVEVLGCQMFRENTYITEFTVPNNCEYLSDEIFRESGIKTIRYGESLKIVANAALSGISPTTFYISSNIISDAYLTGFTNTTWGYGYIINNPKATVYFVGTKEEAETFWGKLAADNASYTEVHYYDYNNVTERDTATGMAIFYNYNRCDAFYTGEHVEDNNPCVINCSRCNASGIAESDPVHDECFTYKYENYLQTGFKVICCSNEGCKYTTSESAPALFIWKGYSRSEGAIGGAYSVAQCFYVNKDAIKTYTDTNKTEFTFGILVAAGTAEGTKAPKLGDDYVISHDLSSIKYDYFEIKVTGIKAEQLATPIIFCAYVIDGESLYYLDGNETKTELSGVSYNDLANA